MHVLSVAEEPPGSWPGIENLFVGRKRAVVINSGDFLAEITGRDGPAAGTFICPSRIETGSDGLHCGAQLPNGLGILQGRSEEHTSELQSHHDLVCRLLLEKKKKKNRIIQIQQNQ